MDESNPCPTLIQSHLHLDIWRGWIASVSSNWTAEHSVGSWREASSPRPYLHSHGLLQQRTSFVSLRPLQSVLNAVCRKSHLWPHHWHTMWVRTTLAASTSTTRWWLGAIIPWRHDIVHPVSAMSAIQRSLSHLVVPLATVSSSQVRWPVSLPSSSVRNTSLYIATFCGQSKTELELFIGGFYARTFVIVQY